MSDDGTKLFLGKLYKLMTVTTTIPVLGTIAELRSLVKTLNKNAKLIGVVPTMGALHAGHLSLVSESQRHTDATIVTIFVNPSQFSPTEDLAKYPQDLRADLEKLAGAGDIFVFAPSAAEMYPAGFSTTITPPNVGKLLEGEFRPTHFAGVATVVLKLLNLTRADFAFFGQKDFQQRLVVQKMVEDLNVPTEIRVCPIVREADGLAMSSRNIYLSAEEREIALSLYRTLEFVEAEIRDGQRDGYQLVVEMRQRLIDGGVTRIDYAAIADPHSLETVETIQLPVVVLLAAYVGKTRLIDNRLIALTD